MTLSCFFRGCRGALPFLAALFLTGSFTGTAGAHPILQNPIWIEVGPSVMKVKLYVSMRELNVIQGLPIAADGAVDMAEAEESAPRHSDYVLSHLDFRGDGVVLPGKIMQITPPKFVGKGVEAPDRAHFIFRMEYPLLVPPAQVTFSHTMVKEFPSAPGVPWDLSYAYRFGPIDATPLKFGAIPRDTEVKYDTGFPQAAGTLPPESKGSPQRPILIQLALLGAALGLGVWSGTRLGGILGIVSISLLVGWGCGMVTGWQIPGFLAAALGGIGILLAAVDNIHRQKGGPPVRRWILAVFFPVISGLTAFCLTGAVPFSKPEWVGLCLLALLGGCLAGAGFASLSGGPRRPLGQDPADTTLPQPDPASPPLFLQLASLAVCVGGLVILFDGLGIRPWAYWLGRLGE